jgi:hypothetical protein
VLHSLPPDGNHSRNIRTVQEAVLKRDVKRVWEILHNCKNEQVWLLRFNQSNIGLGVMFALVCIERCNRDEIRLLMSCHSNEVDGWGIMTMEHYYTFSSISVMHLYISNILVNTNNSNIILFVCVNICFVCLYIAVTCVKCCPICTCIFVHLCISFRNCTCVHLCFIRASVSISVLFVYVHISSCFTCVYVSPFCTCDNIISFRSTWIRPRFLVGFRVAQCLVFCVVFCWQLFVLVLVYPSFTYVFWLLHWYLVLFEHL